VRRNRLIQILYQTVLSLRQLYHTARGLIAPLIGWNWRRKHDLIVKNTLKKTLIMM